MSNVDTREWLQLFHALNDSIDSFHKNKYNEKELERYQSKIDTANAIRKDNREENRQIELLKTKATNDYSDSKKNINDNLKELGLWNITNDMILKRVKNELPSTPGYNTFKDFSLDDLNDDLAYNWQIGEDSRDTYTNMIKASNANQHVHNVLNDYLSEIEGLKNDFQNIGVAEGISNLVTDLGDVQHHIDNNPAKFKEAIPVLDNDGNEMIDANGNVKMQLVDNMLATALKRPEAYINGKKFGFVNQAQIVTDVNKQMKAAIEKEEELAKATENQWLESVEYMFKDLGQVEDRIFSEHKHADRKDLPYVISNTGGKVSSVQGTKKLYENEETSHKLKEKIADKIYKIFFWNGDEGITSAMYSMDTNDPQSFKNKLTSTYTGDGGTATGRNLNNMYEVIRYIHEHGIAKPTEVGVATYGHSNKFKSKDLANLDVETLKNQEAEEEYLVSLINAFMVLDNKYPGLYIPK